MNWNGFKNILCVRADNMGDVIMTTPALRAVKETFNCRLTLLTSTMGSVVTPFIKEIDETIVYDLPWVKSGTVLNGEDCMLVAEKLKQYNFDAAIIFTVYSQSALPAAMLLYMAGIPARLAYCRENPYQLLTHWVPDKEPYTFIQHQVKRDLQLVNTIGAVTNNQQLSLTYSETAYKKALRKLTAIGCNPDENFIIAHPGVSEEKRRYPVELWISLLNRLHTETGLQILLSGSKSENELTQSMQQAGGNKVFNTANILTLEESIAVIAHAALVISVNTSIVHIAAAFKRPVIVLYAQTNPQHTPWLTKNIVLPFSVPSEIKSKNEVIAFVHQSHYSAYTDYPSPATVTHAALQLLEENTVLHQSIYSS